MKESLLDATTIHRDAGYTAGKEITIARSVKFLENKIGNSIERVEKESNSHANNIEETQNIKMKIF